MSKVDDELTRRLHRAERPVDVDAVFEGLERRRSHRERVRRVQTAVLAVTVLAVTVGGFAALSRAFREQPEGPASPPPTESPTAALEGRDIGLGVAMCDLEVMHGIDWDGTGIDGAAWTGAPVDEDGRCSSSADVQHVVAVDRDGDGIAEQGSTSTLRSCLLCRPFDTMDLNEDGVLELVVLEEASSTPTYSLYEVNRPGSERALGVYPIFVVPPGAPAMNLDPNEPTRFMVGGDEGFSGSIACENDWTKPADPSLHMGARCGRHRHGTEGGRDEALVRRRRCVPHRERRPIQRPEKPRAHRSQVDGARLRRRLPPRRLGGQAEDELVQQEHPALRRDQVAVVV